MALYLAIGEVMSIIIRKQNAGLVGDDEAAHALIEFRSEVADAADFRLESVEDHLVRGSLDLIEKHFLNATDAVVLWSAREVASALRNRNDDLVLVASDTRLLRAAAAEGLLTFNPETDTQPRLDQLIAGDS